VIQWKIKEATCRDAVDICDRGDKVKAIKLIRNEAGCGLREAKEFVETGCDFGAVYKSHSGDCEFVPAEESVSYLMGRLFELTAEIAAIHSKLEKM